MTVVSSNKQIIFYVFICQLCHVCVLFSIGSIVFAIYSLEDFDGTIPFNFKSWINFEKCCSYTKDEMVNMLTMVVSYPISGVIFGALITVRAWDFAVTTTLIHAALCCLVMLDFPTNWSWWVCLGISCILMIASGEGVSAVRRYRNTVRLVVPEKNEEPVNYLYR